MYERFTDRARKVMQLANQEAQRFNHDAIDVGHIIVGLAKEGSGVAANVLHNLEVNLGKIRDHIEQTYRGKVNEGSIIMGRLQHTDATKAIVAGACDEARALNHNYVGTEHLLLGVLRQQGELPERFGVTAQQVREEIVRLLADRKPEDQPAEVTATASEFRTYLTAGAVRMAEREKWLEQCDEFPGSTTVADVRKLVDRVRMLEKTIERLHQECECFAAAKVAGSLPSRWERTNK